jgi:hypothetical protein
MTEKKFLDNVFKYEDDKLWKMNKQTKKWKNLDDIKPNKGYVHIGLTINGKRKFYLLHRLVYFFHNQEWDIMILVKIIVLTIGMGINLIIK